MQTAVKNFENLPPILKVEQVAQFLGVSRKVAYALTRQKGFPAVRIGQKRLVIPRDQFIAWLNKKCEQAYVK